MTDRSLSDYRDGACCQSTHPLADRRLLVGQVSAERAFARGWLPAGLIRREGGVGHRSTGRAPAERGAGVRRVAASRSMGL
jgi:hypothetical protein